MSPEFEAELQNKLKELEEKIQGLIDMTVTLRQENTFLKKEVQRLTNIKENAALKVEDLIRKLSNLELD